MFDRKPGGVEPAAVNVDDVIAALSCAKRRELLAAIARSPKTVTQLQRLLGYAFSDVSRHLSELRASGLVECEIHKKEHLQMLTPVTTVRVDAEGFYVEVKTTIPNRLIIIMHELHTGFLKRMAGIT